MSFNLSINHRRPSINYCDHIKQFNSACKICLKIHKNHYGIVFSGDSSNLSRTPRVGKSNFQGSVLRLHLFIEIYNCFSCHKVIKMLLYATLLYPRCVLGLEFRV